MPSTALPLKVTPASTPARASPQPSASGSKTPTKQAIVTNPGEISSPHELTAFVRFPNSCSCSLPTGKLQVETLLEQLDTQFDAMSSQILDHSAFATPRDLSVNP
jgi:heat shock factor-binding protein 1